MFLDGDGAFRHWKYPGAYADQPAHDVQIYQIIRGRWCELRNREMSQRGQGASNNRHRR